MATLKFDFNGKKVLVTGAGQGIGRDIVKALAESGAKVFALSKTKANLETLKKEFPSVTTIEHDLSNISGLEASIRPFLPFDALVNNAGVGENQDFLEVTEEFYDSTMNINLKAALFLSQIVAKSMVSNKIAGSIVQMSSQASKVPLRGHTVYTCSKAALDSLAKSMALELSPLGIRINCVNPTVVMTQMGKATWDNPEMGGPMLERIPLRKFAETEDVVNATLFLLSDAAKMINGTTLPVEGGFWACSSGF